MDDEINCRAVRKRGRALPTSDQISEDYKEAGATDSAFGPELTIVVPTRNERDNIIPLLQRLSTALHGTDWEVLFVDDDSPDGTAALVRTIAQSNRRVRCIQRIRRRGLSSACIEGFLASAAPFIAVMDGDLQHDEKLLPKMLARAKADNFDLVVGSRRVEGGSVGAFGSSRESVSRLGTRLAHNLIGSELNDPMSGFFLLRRAWVERVLYRLSGRGFKILLDLFASATEPVRFVELPYTFGTRASGESKLDSAATIEYFNLLLDKTIGRVVPVGFLLFGLVGGIGVLIHMAAFFVLLFGLPFTYAKAGASLIAMTNNFLLNNAITYHDVRLKGVGLLRGLISFYAICSVGAAADVGIASILFKNGDISWWLSGLAGILVGSVWNYAVSSVFTWRQAR
jgi:dolichol-phosphate mannosyltransferase